MRKLKIVFANLNGNLYADGSRILSAKLKEMGHEVRMVFLIDREGTVRGIYTGRLQESAIVGVIDLLR